MRLLIFSVFLLLAGAIGLAIVLSFGLVNVIGIVLAVIFAILFLVGLICAIISLALRHHRH